MPTSLEQLPVGATAKVVRLQGGFGFQQQVQDLGLRTGLVLRKVEHEGAGPILIQFEAQTVAVGRGIAKRIIVDELSDEP
jgi:Fe2+ transport system protein FeoA